MKFIIRSGKVKGEGYYWCHDAKSVVGHWGSKADAKRFDDVDDPDGSILFECSEAPLPGTNEAPEHSRIVRLLSHEEAKQKAVDKAVHEAEAAASYCLPFLQGMAAIEEGEVKHFWSCRIEGIPIANVSMLLQVEGGKTLGELYGEMKAERDRLRDALRALLDTQLLCGTCERQATHGDPSDKIPLYCSEHVRPDHRAGTRLGHADAIETAVRLLGAPCSS